MGCASVDLIRCVRLTSQQGSWRESKRIYMESGACCNSIPGDFHDTQMTHHAENDEESNSRTRALMESAAKSLLHLTDNRTETAQLHSLQRQKLSAMPDEQDRKRFLVCIKNAPCGKSVPISTTTHSVTFIFIWFAGVSGCRRGVCLRI